MIHRTNQNLKQTCVASVERRKCVRASHELFWLRNWREFSRPVTNGNQLTWAHSRSQGLPSPWPAVGKRKTVGRSDLKSENIGLLAERRMPSFQMRELTDELFGVLLPDMCIVFKTNINRSCKGTFEVAVCLKRSLEGRDCCELAQKDPTRESERNRA